MSAAPASSPGVAVEVVATFGDAIVGVRHAIDPRAGRPRAATRALLAFGVLALLGAGAGLAYAAHVATANAEARAALIAGGRPAWAFRPRVLPAAADVGFALAAGLGLGALVWGLVRRRDERVSPRIRIGRAPGVDFAAPDAPAADHALIAPDGDGFVLRSGGLAGELAGGAPLAAAAVAVTEGLRATVRCGALTFHVAGVAPPRRQPTPLVGTLNRRAAAFLAVSALGHLTVLALLRTIPPAADAAPANLAALEDPMIRAHAASVDDPPVQRDEGDDGGGGEGDGPAAAVAMRLPAGTAGSDRPSADPGRLRSTGDLSRDQAIEQARRAGILSSLDGDRLVELTGTDDLTRGFDDVTAPGGPGGDGWGAPAGSFGRSRHGLGPGGGLIYAGDYHRIPGGREGSSFGICGCGPGGMHGRSAVAPPVVHIGHPQGPDGFQAIIRRYIRRHLPEISYCYEKALLARHDLAGTVTATFLLDASGRVITSSATGVDGEVDTCIAGIVKRIEFPRLAPAGSFQIRYPFTLSRPGR